MPGEEGVDMYPAAQAAFANLKQNIGPDFTFSQGRLGAPSLIA